MGSPYLVEIPLFGKAKYESLPSSSVRYKQLVNNACSIHRNHEKCCLSEICRHYGCDIEPIIKYSTNGVITDFCIFLVKSDAGAKATVSEPVLEISQKKQWKHRKQKKQRIEVQNVTCCNLSHKAPFFR